MGTQGEGAAFLRLSHTYAYTYNTSGMTSTSNLPSQNKQTSKQVKTGQRKGFTTSFLGDTRNHWEHVSVLYRIPVCTHYPGALALEKGDGSQVWGMQEAGGWAGARVSQRGFTEKEEGRGGGSNRPGSPSLRVATTW